MGLIFGIILRYWIESQKIIVVGGPKCFLWHSKNKLPVFYMVHEIDQYRVPFWLGLLEK